MTGVRTAPWLIAAALALVWLAFAPATPDLAAAVYRAGLFEREGFALVNLNWYGGHYTPGYSLLFPPLGALLGVRFVGVLAAIASALLFERIAREHFGDRAARWGALWFGAGTAADLFIGRLTFAVGVAFGLAAVLALQRGRLRLGLGLGVACTFASPVAGLFLALAGVAQWLASRERVGIWLAAAAMTPAVALAVLFPEGGSQPFSTGALAAILLSCGLLLWLVPRHERALRAGALLYLGSALLAFFVASPMGSNASRLGVTFAGPVLLCALLTGTAPARKRQMALVAAVPLLLWQLWAPVRETAKGADDPSAKKSYYEPLLRFLAERDGEAVRVEVPFTRMHWEAVHVARRTPLARGWLTQLDVKLNPLFRSGQADRLDPQRYRAWLLREGVSYVALPDVALDPSSRDEGRLIRRGQPFLRVVRRDRHWAIFEVVGSPGLTDGVGTLARLGSGSFTLRARRPGVTLVRMRFTPYWRIARGRGCVARGAGGWTLVHARLPGEIRVDAAFDPRRLLRGGVSCSASDRGKPEEL